MSGELAVGDRIRNIFLKREGVVRFIFPNVVVIEVGPSAGDLMYVPRSRIHLDDKPRRNWWSVVR